MLGPLELNLWCYRLETSWFELGQLLNHRTGSRTQVTFGQLFASTCSDQNCLILYFSLFAYVVIFWVLLRGRIKKWIRPATVRGGSFRSVRISFFNLFIYGFMQINLQFLTYNVYIPLSCSKRASYSTWASYSTFLFIHIKIPQTEKLAWVAMWTPLGGHTSSSKSKKWKLNMQYPSIAIWFPIAFIQISSFPILQMSDDPKLDFLQSQGIR